MAKTIDHLTLTVRVTAYEHEGCQYDALLIIVAYKKGRGFCVRWQPVKLTGYGYQTGPMPSSDPLVGGGAVVVMEATKNSVKTLEQMRTNLEAAQEGIRAYFDARELDIVNIFLKSVAKCGYTYDFEKQVKDFINRQNNTTMATVEMNNNSETKNVQNAQVTNPSNEAIDVNVGEVTVDSIMPVMQPVEGSEYTVESDGKTATFESVAPNIEKPAVTMPLSEHGTLVIAGVGSDKPKPKRDASGKFAPKVTLKTKTPQTEAALSVVRLVTYKTKKGADAPMIVGFSGDDDPRWKRHFDAKPKWVSAGFRRDMEGNKVCHMMFGTKYMEVAKALCEAYNTADREAWAKAEQACADNYNGIVSGYQAEREARKAAKQAEREAAKAQEKPAKPATGKAEKPAAPAMSDEEQAMFDLFKKFMAGDKEAMAKVGAVLQAA